MSAQVHQKGSYELFETNHHHRILVLNDREWFAWVQGQQGDILVASDSDHVKERTLQQGRFYLADIQGDPKFKDMPHLFLQEGSHYREVILPDGLPSATDEQKKVVGTDDTVGAKELEGYLEPGREKAA